VPAFWSPYYQIAVHLSDSANPSQIGITVNYDGFQEIQDLSPGYLENVSEAVQRSNSRHYNIPYELSRRKVESVLILGGGSGNDAAAALRHNAKHVDVVEIDPVIAGLGRRLTPNGLMGRKKSACTSMMRGPICKRRKEDMTSWFLRRSTATPHSLRFHRFASIILYLPRKASKRSGIY
jgi:Spermine/spermidine synthase domain